MMLDHDITGKIVFIAVNESDLCGSTVSQFDSIFKFEPESEQMYQLKAIAIDLKEKRR